MRERLIATIHLWRKMRKKGRQLSQALKLVAEKFEDIFDKSGEPYVLHLLKVMHYLKTDDEDLMIIALLHDFVEDIYKDRHEDGYFFLRYTCGFSDRVINAVRCLTKIDGEDYESYLARIMTNIDAIRVKLADLRHNSDIRRLKGLRQKDFERMQKYHAMYLALKEAEATFQ